MAVAAPVDVFFIKKIIVGCETQSRCRKWGTPVYPEQVYKAPLGERYVCVFFSLDGLPFC